MLLLPRSLAFTATYTRPTSKSAVRVLSRFSSPIAHTARAPLSAFLSPHRSACSLSASHTPSPTIAPNMTQIERITESLERPELDDRSYRVIRLPNKLEALLVHDPDTDKASAAVNVNVGNFSDQDDMPGMAHAVEHLLFMGTKKVCLPRLFGETLHAGPSWRC